MQKRDNPENREQEVVREEATLGLVETGETPGGKQWKKTAGTFLTVFVYIVFIPFLLYVSPAVSEWVVRNGTPGSDQPVNETRIKKLGSEIGALEKKMDRFTPGNAYLVVNTTENTFTLYRNRKILREGLCSTGSYISLEGEDDKKWVFKTPRGDFKVRGKITDPVWRKPDWAFVEEGLPIPPANHSSRYERGVLGDYALALGDGYLIHGTLYQRFLGLPVTHGCIRMNDADLKEVYETLPVGAKVFIY